MRRSSPASPRRSPRSSGATTIRPVPPLEGPAVTGHLIAFEGGEGSGKSTQAGPPRGARRRPPHPRAGRHAPRRVRASAAPRLGGPRHHAPRRGAADGGRPGPARRRGHPTRARRRGARSSPTATSLVRRLPGLRAPARPAEIADPVGLGHPGPAARPGRPARGAAVGVARAHRRRARPARGRRRATSTAASTTASSSRPSPTPTASRWSTAPSPRTRWPSAIWQIVSIRFPDLV